MSQDPKLMKINHKLSVLGVKAEPTALYVVLVSESLALTPNFLTPKWLACSWSLHTRSTYCWQDTKSTCILSASKTKILFWLKYQILSTYSQGNVCQLEGCIYQSDVGNLKLTMNIFFCLLHFLLFVTLSLPKEVTI